jgi:hypothetical protein
MSKAIAFFSDTAPVGKTPPTLELFQLFSASPQVGHLVFESATAAQKTGTFKTPLFRGGMRDFYAVLSKDPKVLPALSLRQGACRGCQYCRESAGRSLGIR